MPTLVIPHRQSAFASPSLDDEWDFTPEPQSDEGKEICAAARAALRHWSERSEHLLAEREADDDLPYESVPVRPVFTVRVRYVPAGELKPLPYPQDE